MEHERYVLGGYERYISFDTVVGLLREIHLEGLASARRPEKELEREREREREREFVRKQFIVSVRHLRMC